MYLALLYIDTARQWADADSGCPEIPLYSNWGCVGTAKTPAEAKEMAETHLREFLAENQGWVRDRWVNPQ